jgi:hypothetical protein
MSSWPASITRAVAHQAQLLLYGFPESLEQEYVANRQTFVRAADLATVFFNILFLFRGLKLEAGNLPVCATQQQLSLLP